MKSWFSLFVVTFALCANSSNIMHTETYFKVITGQGHALQAGRYTHLNTAPFRGTVIFLHGLGDRFENHEPLFLAMRQGGFDVVGINLPGHGDSEGSLNSYSFEDLSRMVDSQARLSSERGLIQLVGWSTGGLLAAYFMNHSSLANQVSRVVLQAPAIAPKTLIGSAGWITNNTLSSASIYYRPLGQNAKPATPFAIPVFAVRMLKDSYGIRSNPENYPSSVPTLFLQGGLADGGIDNYVKAKGNLKFAKTLSRLGKTITTVSCPSLYHEMDNEPGLKGMTVRQTIVEFLSDPSAELTADPHVCRPAFSH